IGAAGEGRLRRSPGGRAADPGQAPRASVADVFRVWSCKEAGRWLAYFCRTARASIPEWVGCACGHLDTGFELDGRGWLGCAGVSLVGARLSHGLCFLIRPREWQLRPNADPFRSDVRTD